MQTAHLRFAISCAAVAVHLFVGPHVNGQTLTLLGSSEGPDIASFLTDRGASATLLLDFSPDLAGQVLHIYLWNPDGSKASQNVVSLSGTGQMQIPMDLGVLESKTGAAALTVDWPSETNAGLAVLKVDRSNGAQVPYPLRRLASVRRKQDLVASWWRPDDDTTNTVTLFNASTEPADVIVSAASDGVSLGFKAVTISAHNTATLDIHELLPPDATRLGTGSHGTVSISSLGTGFVYPSLLIERARSKSALLTSFSSTSKDPAVLQVLGIPEIPISTNSLSTQDLNTFALLSNNSSAEISPLFTLYSSSRLTPLQQALSSEPIASGHTELINVSQMAEGALPSHPSRGALTLSYLGAPGALNLRLFTMTADGVIVQQSDGIMLPADLKRISYLDERTAQMTLHGIVSGTDESTVQATLFYQSRDTIKAYSTPPIRLGRNVPLFSLSQHFRPGVRDSNGAVFADSSPSGLMVISALPSGDIATREPAFDSNTVQSIRPLCAPAQCVVPTNLTNVGSSGSGTTLLMNYTYSASDGNVADLGTCTLSELVLAPTSSSTYSWPVPFPTYSQANPLIYPAKGFEAVNSRSFSDKLKLPSTSFRGTTSGSFSLTQYYRYRCGCYNGGAYTNFGGPFTIYRSAQWTSGKAVPGFVPAPPGTFAPHGTYRVTEENQSYSLTYH